MIWKTTVSKTEQAVSKFAFGKIGNWSNKKQLDYKDKEYKSSLAE